MSESDLFQCYNRGCGQKYSPESNKDDSCRHHPGEPFFHDAYKGWSCCNKKCTDFTEFLNIKGCTVSQHSNIKPPEPEKPAKTSLNDTDVIEVKPLVKTVKERPPYDSPLKTIKPEVAAGLEQPKLDTSNMEKTTETQIGTSCKNGGCKVSYSGPETDDLVCVYHPGSPIFHEGMKFWSCCQKRTTDFTAFLNQIGCQQGKHLWYKEQNAKEAAKCRWDYHQTGSHVIVSIYAKDYCLQNSFVKLNPIRMVVNLVFPKQNNNSFEIDVELKGIVDVEASQVSMFRSKVEIKLKKAEAGNWSQLEVAKLNKEQITNKEVGNLAPKVDAVNLDDL